MTSLNDLVSCGKVNYLGVSDTRAWVVAKANQYARDHGLRQFVVYQGLWNAAKRDFERDIVPMFKDEGMGLIPGELSPRVVSKHKPPSRSVRKTILGVKASLQFLKSECLKYWKALQPPRTPILQASPIRHEKQILLTPVILYQVCKI